MVLIFELLLGTPRGEQLGESVKMCFFAFRWLRVLRDLHSELIFCLAPFDASIVVVIIILLYLYLHYILLFMLIVAEGCIYFFRFKFRFRLLPFCLSSLILKSRPCIYLLYLLVIANYYFKLYLIFIISLLLFYYNDVFSIVVVVVLLDLLLCYLFALLPPLLSLTS